MSEVELSAQFAEAVKEWDAKEQAAVRLEGVAESLKAQWILNSQATSEDRRKADAVAKSAQVMDDARKARVAADVAKARVDFLLALAGRRG